MHGVGLRSSSHAVQSPGQGSIEFIGSCPKAILATKQEKKVFQSNMNADLIRKHSIDIFQSESILELVRNIIIIIIFI
jgi:hypothetical protein